MNTYVADAFAALAGLARSGDMVRIGYTLAGRGVKLDPMSAEDGVIALRAAIDTADMLGLGEPTSVTVWRVEDGLGVLR